MDADEERRREIAKLDYRDYQAETVDRLKMQADFAHAALRGLTLANGGAIVALFTFLGNRPEASLNREALWWSFALFAAGLTSTLTCYIAAFFSQGYYMKATQLQAWNAQEDMVGGEGKREFKAEFRRGEIFESVGVVSAILALVFFIVGSWLALRAVLS